MKEYPVSEIVQVRSEYEPSVRLEVRNNTLIDPIYYRAYPGCAYGEELTSWNMNRYRGRRIGMSGNIRGAGVRVVKYQMLQTNSAAVDNCLI